MKNNRLLITFLLGVVTLFCSCDIFLDETPNKSGSAYIYHMDQLYGMMGSPDLYLTIDASYSSFTITEPYMYWQMLLGDAVELDPEFWYVGMQGLFPTAYEVYSWNKDRLDDQAGMNILWTPSWKRIYTFNTVLENLDKVIQTTKNIHRQVEGEARFGRAYYHFMLLTQYCLWKEDAPGIGYRENTDVNGIPARQTVGYTLGRIYEDLELAESALKEAGRTTFDFKHNFRPTVPTIQAFRARVDLYRGNYESALSNASAALEAHHTLVDFKNDPLYELFPSTEYHLLDPTDCHIERTVTAKEMVGVNNRGLELIPEYEELYLPNLNALDYSGNVPISDSFYQLFDKENDARWIHFYNDYKTLDFASGILHTIEVEGQTVRNCIKWSDQQWLKPAWCHTYSRFYYGTCSIIGMTTAEMYLIKAECLARSGKTGEAAELLKMLRRTRFMNENAANNIGGNVQDILDERMREMGAEWRFFDIKRLNGAENAGIAIRRKILSDITDPNSVTELVIAPDDPRWALPFNPQEAENMGWRQNEGWE